METFFISGGTIEVVPAEELLLSRYHNMDYIMALDFEEGIDLIYKAHEKEQEKYAWDLYVSGYPFMTENNSMTFSEFKKRLLVDIPRARWKENEIENKSNEDLIHELSMINAAGKEEKE